jgi:hypothetical protein
MPAGPSRLQDKVSIEVPTDDDSLMSGKVLFVSSCKKNTDPETLLEQPSDVWRTVITGGLRSQAGVRGGRGVRALVLAVSRHCARARC